LGKLYDQGLGTNPDKEKAKQLIEKALKMGYKPEK
jgi:TPR repeat protein